MKRRYNVVNIVVLIAIGALLSLSFWAIMIYVATMWRRISSPSTGDKLLKSRQSPIEMLCLHHETPNRLDIESARRNLFNVASKFGLKTGTERHIINWRMAK